MQPHDEFLELCAVATTGELSAEERERLNAHLAVCSSCREAFHEFEAVVDLGIPQMVSQLASIPAENEIHAFDLDENHLDLQEAQEAEAGKRELQREREFASSSHLAAAQSKSRGPAIPETKIPQFARLSARPVSNVNWNLLWLPLAASVLLALALGIYAYRLDKAHNAESAAARLDSHAQQQVTALEQRISDLGHDRELLTAQLRERDRLLSGLQAQVREQGALLSDLKTARAALQDSLAANAADRARLAAENAALSQKFDTAAAALEHTQARLDSLRARQNAGRAEVAGLQSRITDLSGQLRARDAEIDRQDALLSHDSEIRELMGARDLYIAEVYDVGRDGQTKKPFGRIFYTKGKSLVFYAYDLDNQSGIKPSSIFQAWGRRGPEEKSALNLGVFVPDNPAKKRWVLKFDKPKELSQIDAVFVTVEPKGGSHAPSGKPLLFAYLRVSPNHP